MPKTKVKKGNPLFESDKPKKGKKREKKNKLSPRQEVVKALLKELTEELKDLQKNGDYNYLVRQTDCLSEIRSSVTTLRCYSVTDMREDND